MPRAFPRGHDRDRHMAAVWTRILRGPRRREPSRCVAIPFDPRAQPRGLLQGLPAQQLDRRRDLRGHRARPLPRERATMILVIYAHPYPGHSRACAALLEAIAPIEDLEVRSLYSLYPDFDVDPAQERSSLE